MTKPLGQIAQTMSGSKSSNFSTEYAQTVGVPQRKKMSFIILEAKPIQIALIGLSAHHR
jgi:hypothetical protein